MLVIDFWASVLQYRGASELHRPLRGARFTSMLTDRGHSRLWDLPFNGSPQVSHGAEIALGVGLHTS